MRIGIYNRWLTTLGGGERHMLALALALANHGHQVELLSQQMVDVATIERRLGMQVGQLAQRRLADEPSGGAVTEASGDYDLFINASHGEFFPSLARRSWILVFFPEADLEGGLNPWPYPYFWRGHYAVERDQRGRPFRWLAPEGALWFPQPAGQAVHLTVARPVSGSFRSWLATVHPAWVAPSAASTGQGGAATDLPARRVQLRPDRPGHLMLRFPRGAAPHGYLLRWQTEPLALRDPRPLGVRLLDLAEGPALPLRWPLWRRDRLPEDEPDLDWVIYNYHRFLANSDYTARWIMRRWGVQAEVLPPAVPQLQPGPKRPTIVSVGRFFRGLHAKRQDALLVAFRRLHPDAPGWELQLAGGLDEDNHGDAEYLAELRAAAAGLPVTFHVNEPTEVVNRLYGEATLYWHAAGYNTDPEVSPQAQEHFGISTIEAMSAGAVPLVYASGGPLDVVRDGVDGHHWRHVDELVELTRALIASAERREAMAGSARARAAEFGEAAFVARVARLLKQLGD